MELPRLAQILKTHLDCSPLLACGFAFLVNDGRAEYGTSIYQHFLAAVASRKLTGQLLVFAGDAFANSEKPIYLLQVVPVLGAGKKKLKGITYKEFELLRDAVIAATTSDTGLEFMSDNSEMADVLSVAEETFPLRGNIDVTDGKVTKITRSQSNPTFFEMVCSEMYPGIPVEEYADDEEDVLIDGGNEGVLIMLRDDDNQRILVRKNSETGNIEQVAAGEEVETYLTKIHVQNNHMPFIEQLHTVLSNYALSSYETDGRGAIVVSNEPGEVLRYTPETQLGYITEAKAHNTGDNNLINAVETYSPESQFIIAICEDDITFVHCMRLASSEDEECSSNDDSVLFKGIRAEDEGEANAFKSFLNTNHKELSDSAIKGYKESGRGVICVLKESGHPSLLYFSEAMIGSYAISFMEGNAPTPLPQEVAEFIKRYNPVNSFLVAMHIGQGVVCAIYKLHEDTILEN